MLWDATGFGDSRRQIKHLSCFRDLMLCHHTRYHGNRNIHAQGVEQATKIHLQMQMILAEMSGMRAR